MEGMEPWSKLGGWWCRLGGVCHSYALLHVCCQQEAVTFTCMPSVSERLSLFYMYAVSERGCHGCACSSSLALLNAPSLSSSPHVVLVPWRVHLAMDIFLSILTWQVVMLFNAWDFYLVSFLLFLFSVLYPTPPSKTPYREMLNCSDTLLTSTLSSKSLPHHLFRCHSPIPTPHSLVFSSVPFTLLLELICWF